MDGTTNEMLKLMTKLLALSLISTLEEKKGKLLKSEKATAAYSACDGKRTMPEISKIAKYGSVTSVEKNLPRWESEGLIVSVGYSNNKRYLALENLPGYVSELAQDSTE